MIKLVFKNDFFNKKDIVLKLVLGLVFLFFCIVSHAQKNFFLIFLFRFLFNFLMPNKGISSSM